MPLRSPPMLSNVLSAVLATCLAVQVDRVVLAQRCCVVEFAIRTPAGGGAEATSPAEDFKLVNFWVGPRTPLSNELHVYLGSAPSIVITSNEYSKVNLGDVACDSRIRAVTEAATTSDRDVLCDISSGAGKLYLHAFYRNVDEATSVVFDSMIDTIDPWPRDRSGCDDIPFLGSPP